MAKKIVIFDTKPLRTAEEWVSTGGDLGRQESPPGNQEKTQDGETRNERRRRLTLDIPLSLHKRLKIYCAEKEISIVEELTALIEKTYSVKNAP